MFGESKLVPWSRVTETWWNRIASEHMPTMPPRTRPWGQDNSCNHLVDLIIFRHRRSLHPLIWLALSEIRLRLGSRRSWFKALISGILIRIKRLLKRLKENRTWGLPEADKMLVRHAQRTHSSREIDTLTNKDKTNEQSLPKSSSIRKLAAFLRNMK